MEIPSSWAQLQRLSRQLAKIHADKAVEAFLINRTWKTQIGRESTFQEVFYILTYLQTNKQPTNQTKRHGIEWVGSESIDGSYYSSTKSRHVMSKTMQRKEQSKSAAYGLQLHCALGWHVYIRTLKSPKEWSDLHAWRRPSGNHLFNYHLAQCHGDCAS